MVENQIVISGLHGDSANPYKREFGYKLFLMPDEHQEKLLMKMLYCRYILARKCGYKTYSERYHKRTILKIWY